MIFFEILENVEHLHKTLTRLSLAKNKFKKIENLESLTNLSFLTFQSNRVTKIEGLSSLLNLKELYLRRNNIPSSL